MDVLGAFSYHVRLRNKVTERRPLLNAKEVATKLGVSVHTVYQWAYERRIPSVKLLGTALRFRESDIGKLIKDGERRPL